MKGALKPPKKTLKNAIKHVQKNNKPETPDSTSKGTAMDGPDTGKSSTYFMLFFIGLCTPADLGKMGKVQQKKRSQK